MSSRQFSGTSGGATGISPAQAGLWSYAVPAHEEPLEHATAYAVSNEPTSTTRPRQPLSGQMNGNARPKTRSKSKSIQGLDAAFVASGPLRPTFQDIGDAGGTTSDADSLLDPSKSNKDRTRATSHERPRVKRKGSLGAVSALKQAPDNDPDKWIHRDKLQQIEIREMMEQGRKGGLASRSASRAGASISRAATNPDSDAPDDTDDYAALDKKHQRNFAPTLPSNDLRESSKTFGLGAPGDESETSPVHSSSHNRRPSTSKIPVTRNSPTTDESMTALRNDKVRRARSGSQGSQNMLESMQVPSSPGAASSDSPPKKAKVPRKGGPANRGKTKARGGKPSQAQLRNATSPTNGSTSRPGTSSGRPTTARPDGDPPWLETMYKPDPRLPPDQQMLPTHARRLAEQHMAFDPSAEPRKHPDLMLLDDEDSANDASSSAREDQVFGQPGHSPRSPDLGYQRASPSQSPNLPQQQDASPERQHNGYLEPRERGSFQSDGRSSPNTQEKRNSGQWPLRTLSFNKYAPEQEPQASPKSDTATTSNPARPGLSIGESGSYSLMPSIQTPQEMEQRSHRSRLSTSIPVTTLTATPETIRVPEEPEQSEKQQKKTCLSCCTVM